MFLLKIVSMTNLARNVRWDLLELVLAQRAVEHAQASQAPSLHPFPEFALQHFTLLRAVGARPAVVSGCL